MLLSEELTQIRKRRESKSPKKSTIMQASNLIVKQFPKLTSTLPYTYKDELRKWVSEDDKRYEYLNGKNIIHLLTDKENLHDDPASINDDDVKVRVNLIWPFDLLDELLRSSNTWNFDDLIAFNTTYQSFPVQVNIFDDNFDNESKMLPSYNFDTTIEFPIYAFKSCLEKEGFELKKKQVTAEGTRYDLIW